MIEMLKKSIEIAMASKHSAAPEFIKELDQLIIEIANKKPDFYIFYFFVNTVEFLLFTHC